MHVDIDILPYSINGEDRIFVKVFLEFPLITVIESFLF